MKIAIIDIIGLPYDGTTVFNQGLGGSESAVTFMAYELAQIGFDVTVFNACDLDHARPGNYGGVTYRPVSDLAQDHYFDIVVSSRTVVPFTDPADYHRLNDGRAFPLQPYNLYDRILSKAKMRVLWMHDTFCLGDTLIEELTVANRITDVFALSDFHLSYITNCDHGRRRNFEVLKRKMFITRNGAYCHNPNVDIAAKDRNLFVYNASVTKGMMPLVNHIWPRVKQFIPDARLKVIGGYYRFSTAHEPDAQEQDWRRMSVDPAYADLGIEFTGVIPQKEIAEILSSANFMIYPAAFPETFGISALESLLYNTPLITCRFGALEEVALEGASYLLDYAIEPNGLFPNINLDHQVALFVAMTVQAYSDPYLHQQKQYYCNIVKPYVGWNTVALQWKQHFYKQTGAYLSRDEYVAVTKINKQVHKIWNRRFQNTVEFESYKSGSEQEIVVISTFYNCQDYIERCIESVAAQDYDNYRHILVDDCSTDNTVDVVIAAIDRLPESIRNRFDIVCNQERKGAVYNQVAAIREIANPDTIVMILDGDDSLVNDNTIFSYYNSTYDGTTEFTYGSCWSMVDNIPLISQPYPEVIKQARAYRQHQFNWILPYTHLRTFKQRLIKDIPDANFQDADGNWFRAGGDGSTFYSLIEAADPTQVKCLQQVVYNYNDASPLNDYKVNSSEQTRNALTISGRKQVEKYSVVVPTMWRVADQFVGFVQALCNHPSVGEVVIINNDNTRTPVLPNNDKIKLHDFGRNIYVNPAWNYGVEVSEFDRICIVNDDVVFDTAVFEKLQSLLTPTAGVFGLCPGVTNIDNNPAFDQPPITTGSIDIVPWTGQHTYGFGCLMFVHKQSWTPIPQGLDIYFGDNFIFDKMLADNKKNYIVTNMNFYSQFAATTSDGSITAGFLDKERPVFDEIKRTMFTPTPIETPVVIKKKTILIAIPTARNIEPETFKSIYDLIIPDGFEVTFQYFYGYNVDQVRNLIADWVINGFDYLFSVDSDISFPPDTLQKLLAHNRDLVSGLYIQRIPGRHQLEVYKHNGNSGQVNIPYEEIKGAGLVEIAACGFGCVLVKTQVFKAIPYPHFVYHSAINHANTVSEDVDFCRKAVDRGFTLWADTSIQCKHTGSYVFEIDNSIVANLVDKEQKRLRDLGAQRLLPWPHLEYLTKLRDSGYQPRVIYDIGACVLHWTSEVSALWPNAEFIAFEAMDAAEFLYKERGMRYHMGVLSSVDGATVNFYQNNEHPGGNSYYLENAEVNSEAPAYFNESHRRSLKTHTLDTVVFNKGFPLPDLVKMDVQGAELDVLMGASSVLVTAKHVILELQQVEYNKGAPMNTVVIDYMNQIGFDCLGMFHNAGPDGDYHFVRRT